MSTKKELSFSISQPAKKERKAFDVDTKPRLIKLIIRTCVFVCLANMKLTFLSYAFCDLKLTNENIRKRTICRKMIQVLLSVKKT